MRSETNIIDITCVIETVTYLQMLDDKNKNWSRRAFYPTPFMQTNSSH